MKLLRGHDACIKLHKVYVLKALLHLDKFHIGPNTNFMGFIAETTNTIAKILLKLSIKMQYIGLVYKYSCHILTLKKVKCLCLTQTFRI